MREPRELYEVSGRESGRARPSAPPLSLLFAALVGVVWATGEWTAWKLGFQAALDPQVWFRLPAEHQGTMAYAALAGAAVMVLAAGVPHRESRGAAGSLARLPSPEGATGRGGLRCSFASRGGSFFCRLRMHLDGGDSAAVPS